LNKITIRIAIALCGLGLLIAPTYQALAAGLPVLKVGHVGHDHQIALYVAADEGRALEKKYGVYLEKLKDQQAYILHDRGRKVAQIQIIRVGGGSKMPAALEQGHIEVGLGGLGPTAKFIDKGADMKVLAPLNNDGDALVLGSTMKADGWDSFVREVKASERPIKIGYKAPMAVAYMIMIRALKEEGITQGSEPFSADGTPNKVITLNLQGLTNALPSLDSGIVDGVVVNEPMASLLEHKGAGRIVADLSSLPPKGKWEGHPCCVVAARGDAIRKKREIIKSLLKAIAAGGDLIAKDRKRALRAESRWTRTERAVGRKSIANVDYVFSPDREWIRGVDTWIELMVDSGHFKKALKGKSPKQIRGDVLDLRLMDEVLKEMGTGQKR
jgi:NitT/TauT family transport system substrate-binding protein